jgi:hypothetical protein
LEEVAHSPQPHAQGSVALEADTSSGMGSRSSARPYHGDGPNLGLDTTVNVIEELVLSQFDDEAPFTPT